MISSHTSLIYISATDSKNNNQLLFLPLHENMFEKKIKEEVQPVNM